MSISNTSQSSAFIDTFIPNRARLHSGTAGPDGTLNVASNFSGIKMYRNPGVSSLITTSDPVPPYGSPPVTFSGILTGTQITGVSLWHDETFVALCGLTTPFFASSKAVTFRSTFESFLIHTACRSNTPAPHYVGVSTANAILDSYDFATMHIGTQNTPRSNRVPVVFAAAVNGTRKMVSPTLITGASSTGFYTNIFIANSNNNAVAQCNTAQFMPNNDGNVLVENLVIGFQQCIGPSPIPYPVLSP